MIDALPNFADSRHGMAVAAARLLCLYKAGTPCVMELMRASYLPDSRSISGCEVGAKCSDAARACTGAAAVSFASISIEGARGDEYKEAGANTCPHRRDTISKACALAPRYHRVSRAELVGLGRCALILRSIGPSYAPLWGWASATSKCNCCCRR